MKHDTDHIPCFDDPAEEREWLLQESAMRRERLHLDDAGDNARSARYRLLTRALRAPSSYDLPPDFAAQVSAKTALYGPTMALERVLTITLIGVLVLAAIIVTCLYGAAWWPAFKALIPPSTASRWWLVLAGCLGLSWALGRWSRGNATSR